MNLKYDTNEPIYETGNRLTDKESRPVVAKRESVRGGMEWDGGLASIRLSLVAQMVRNLPAMQETWV